MHIRSKDEYIQMIETYLEQQETRPLDHTLSQAFEDYREEEDFSAWCASVAHGAECPVAGDLLARFIESFPLSFHPIQVDWAEQLIQLGSIDEGANEARAYLNRMHQYGMAEHFDEMDLVRDGCSRAFLLLTSVYTEIAARSYSRRIIEYAMLLQLDPFWQTRFQSEHRRLTDELKNPRFKAADDKWEQFFRTGEAAEDLVLACKVREFPVLARRVEVIARLFSEQPEFQVNDDEMFQMLYKTDKDVFVLV